VRFGLPSTVPEAGGFPDNRGEGAAGQSRGQPLAKYRKDVEAKAKDLDIARLMADLQRDGQRWANRYEGS
jgi:hypothetical protein